MINLLKDKSGKVSIIPLLIGFVIGIVIIIFS